MKRKQKEEANQIAKERVEKLFDQAEKAAAQGEFESANRYIKMAWNIKLKFQLRLNSYQKKLFCKKCLAFLIDGKTGKYRTENKELVITCQNCGDVKRIPLKKSS